MPLSDTAIRNAKPATEPFQQPYRQNVAVSVWQARRYLRLHGL